MNFDPQKIFVGVVDFFSVLMPGGFLAYLARPWIASHFVRQVNLAWSSTEGWMIFLFCSYLLGHFIFLVGALLDQRIYDPFRQAAYWGQVARLADGKYLSMGPLRRIVKWKLFFGEHADRAVILAERLKAQVFDNIAADQAVNAFQWCKTVLSIKHPAGLVAVERLEADSKFFRSFVVVSFLLVVHYSFDFHDSLSVRFRLVPIYVLMLFLALWRYIDQRSKASQRAYWLVMALEAFQTPPGLNTEPLARKDKLTHSGGIVFRIHGENLEYRLVEASSNRTVWVLPKGRIQSGEDPRKTAVREITEETGHWARVRTWVDDKIFDQGEQKQFVRFYLMELVEESKEDQWPPENRIGKWLSLSTALKEAAFDETRALLQKADAQIELKVEKRRGKSQTVAKVRPKRDAVPAIAQ
jgi:8-oxo-dGTP pyrophosphatase MutT (NUDIX family)